ncbi:MAG: HlyC/CorC family transporter [Magnetococcales bacterium]|nr:HlyC/CorC family transporter [Magnetococcales bacterium]
MEIIDIILLMLGCLMMEAFFSGAEIGVVSADRIKLRHDAAKGNNGAKLALKMLEKPEFLLSTTLVGTNIAIVTNTTLATLLAVQLFGKENSWAAIAIVAPLIWVFGEIVPKSIFQQKANTITPKIIYIIKGASYLFYPILMVFSAVTRMLTHLSGIKGGTPFTLKKEIDIILKLPDSSGDVRPEEKTMIRRMFNFGETKVRDIAKPLIDVTAIPSTLTCRQANKISWDCSHIRLPVFKGQIYQIIGIYNARENMLTDGDTPIESLIKPARYIAASKSIEDLLEEFQETGSRFAIIVDEYGAAEGIVTLEDIMERIVGEIDDEYDKDKVVSSDWVKKISEKCYVVNPRIDLITLEEDWGIVVPDGPYETLGGFLMELAGDIPKQGQLLKYQKTTFLIEKTAEKLPREVRIQLQ